ncbi:MAG TPA: hypothetical protein VE219_01540, partial [Candidatus Sulfotelmatobacter sp.]|nr:hypothetical protein [Candidatus Sulfotelmatobacter sp.]
PPLEAASLPTPPIEEALEPPSTVAEEEDGTNPTAAIEEDAIGSQPAGPSAMTAPASKSAAIAAPHMAPAVAPPALAPPLPEPEISAASEPLLDAESDTLPSAAHADSAVAVATAEAELSGIPVRDVLVGFKIIARNRLQRSASRIEYLIDEGAQESRSAQDVIADVRRLSIRGVMQSTIDDVADEMVTFAQARLREGAVQ